jgi:hypothetical protein
MKIVDLFLDSAYKWRYIVEIEPGRQIMLKFPYQVEDSVVLAEALKQLNI